METTAWDVAYTAGAGLRKGIVRLAKGEKPTSRNLTAQLRRSYPQAPEIEVHRWSRMPG